MGLEIAAAIGLASAIGGTAYSSYSGNMAAKQSRKAEALRQRQLNLDSAMKQREIFRKTQLSRAQAVSRTNQAGISPGGSSLPGAIGSITQRGLEDTNYNVESTAIGNDLFESNARQASFRGQAELGQGISNLGMNLIQSLPTLSKIGTEITGPRPKAGFPSAGYRGPSISTIY